MTVLQQPTSVADLMTIEPIVIQAHATLAAAEEMMREFHVSGLPVVDMDGRLVGVISQTDFLHLADPETRALIRLAPKDIRIADVMSHPAVTVQLTTTLREAAQRMIRERVHRLVAVDSLNRLIGVLSALDYVALFAEA